jgi:hypothetical protein
LLRLPIKRSGIYYWRFNLLLTVVINTLGTESELNAAAEELKAHSGLLMYGRVKPNDKTDKTAVENVNPEAVKQAVTVGVTFCIL